MEQHTICPACGHANQAGAHFCGSCGRLLPAPKAKSRRGWLIGAGVIVLLLIIAALFAFGPLPDLLASPTPSRPFAVAIQETDSPETTVPESSTSGLIEEASVSVQETAVLTQIVTNVPSKTPIPTKTLAPSSTPTSTQTATIAPTATPSATPAATLPPLPTPCSTTVLGALRNFWQSHENQLGCPSAAGGSGIGMAVEDFQSGRMIWRSNNRQIYVLYNNGRWAAYNDTWREGQAEFACGTAQSPPTPKRGFGKVWCNNSDVRQGMGDATNAEWGDTSTIQDFTGGLIISLNSGRTYIFYDDGTWR